MEMKIRMIAHTMGFAHCLTRPSPTAGTEYVLRRFVSGVNLWDVVMPVG